MSTSEPPGAHPALPIIVGRFFPDGWNHGKPTWKKPKPPNGLCDVFIYFWDARDGEGFSGWWFGESVGGSQVWSRNADGSPSTPPRFGWRIPYYD